MPKWSVYKSEFEMSIGMPPWCAVSPERWEWTRFDTWQEAFDYAFARCSDRREVFGVKADGDLVAWGAYADMDQLTDELKTEGLVDACLVYLSQRSGTWVEP